MERILAYTHPEVAKEWHPTKNIILTPHDISPGSDKKIWWQCQKGHEWETKCQKRTRKIRPTGCPYCSGNKVCRDNCLANLYPKIAQEWHPIKNGTITSQDIVAGSHKNYWWLGKCGHEWITQPRYRIRDATGCPYCSNNKVCVNNCLTTLFPDVADEWHPVKNSGINPNDVVAGTEKKYWWMCEKGHEWKASCESRTRKTKSTGCPICKESKGEKKIVKYLEINNYKFKRQAKFKTCKYKSFLPFDFLVKTSNKEGFLIEYNGKQHYYPTGFGSKDKKRIKKEFIQVVIRDFIKEQWGKNRLFVIPYWDYHRINEILNDIFIGKKPVFSEPSPIVKKYTSIREKIRNNALYIMHEEI